MTEQIRQHISKKRAEAGQAIIFVALFMVVMVGMLGLAIDGGGLLFLWRDAQGAADSAALSAAYARCAGSTNAQIKGRGLETADRNGFRNEPGEPSPEVRVILGREETETVLDRTTGDTVTEKVFIERQLERALGSGHGLSPSHYVWVDIRAEKPAFFIQVVYSGPLVVNPTAMSACDPGYDTSNIPGAFAYGTGCGNGGLDFTGARSLFIGDMHTNSGIKFPGGGGGSPTVFNDTIVTYSDGSSVGNTGAITNREGADRVVVRTEGGTEYTWDVDGPVPEKEVEFMTTADLASLYGPGGLISQYIINTYGPDYYHTELPTNDYYQGLYYLTTGSTVTLNMRDVTIHGQGTNNPDRGLTIISDNKIVVNHDKSYSGYPWEFFQPIFRDQIDGKNYPAFIVVSTWEDPNPTGCAGGQDAIEIKQTVDDYQNFNPVDQPVSEMTLGMHGVFYATERGMAASASRASYRGVMIAKFISLSMARGYFWHDPSLIPPIPPNVSKVPTVGD